nr:unnamed protein product [Callosobruchus analis]
MEQRHKKVSTQLNSEDIVTGNSDEDSGEDQRKSEKNYSKKANTRENSGDIAGISAELVSDTEEFASIRKDILQLRRRRVKHVREDDRSKGSTKLSLENSEETELSLSGDSCAVNLLIL